MHLLTIFAIHEDSHYGQSHSSDVSNGCSRWIDQTWTASMNQCDALRVVSFTLWQNLFTKPKVNAALDVIALIWYVQLQFRINDDFQVPLLYTVLFRLFVINRTWHFESLKWRSFSLFQSLMMSIAICIFFNVVHRFNDDRLFKIVAK